MTDGPWVQTVARARKGVVRVISPRASGSGYFAHANGVIVTSQSLVEYEPAVTIVADDGKRVEARVVRVDVRRDLAFLLPRELITPHPLHEVPTAPRLGEPVAVLAQCANGAVVLPSVVAALTRSSEGVSHVQIGELVGEHHLGAPLVDAAGRVVGLSTRPLRVRGASGAARRQLTFLSHSEIAEELAVVSEPADQLADATPVYACPGCRQPFSPSVERCLRCGALLPHAVATEPDVGARRGRDQTGAAAETEGVLQGARVVTELLATLGIVANRMRRAPRSWRLGFAHEAGGQETDVSIELDPSGRQLVFVAPVVRLPESAHEAMFRLLLTLNDETVGAFRLSLVGDLVLLSTMDFTHAVLKQKASKLLRELCVEAAHYRGLLHEAYGAEPVTALEG